MLAEESGGYVATKDLKQAGLNVYDIKVLLEEGKLERIKRGFYRWTDTQHEYHDMIEAARLVSGGVFCLFSALTWHELTTYIPKKHTIAIPNKAHKPVLPSDPPIKLYYFSDARYVTGVENVKLNGQPIKIYNLEKTVCDAVYYRNKIGLDIMKEVLENYVVKRGKNIQKLMGYAETLRVITMLKKYLEVLL